MAAMITYKDYLDGGGEQLFATRSTGRADGAEQVRCVCGHWDWPVQFLDVSALPDAFTDGETYACPVCVAGWQRSLKKFDPADDFIHWAEWQAEFAARLGASRADVAAYKSIALARLKLKLPRIAKREQLYIDEIAKGADGLEDDLQRHADDRAAIQDHIASLPAEIAALKSK